jgi:F-type H+-transporting ATPase subunit b
MKMRRQLTANRSSEPVQVRVGAGALTCPATRSSAATRVVAPLGAGLLMLVLLAFSAVVSPLARAQEPSAPSSQPSSQPNKPSDPAHETIAGELVKETREAAGEDQEENVNLKHARPVRWLARKINWSVHGTHLLLSGINFFVIAAIIIWAGRKFLPGLFRYRSDSIQQALQQARAASHDANRRLADIENRLRQLDVEIGRMQSAAESEAAAEEARIQKAAEEDVRKVVQAAQQEIAAAAKQARRELSNYTASLAIALASKQINVDANTDQVLVRTFAAKLASNKNGGKDGH